MRSFRAVLVAFAALTVFSSAPYKSASEAQQTRNAMPTISPAIDGILSAFQRRPLVAIGDNHGMAQEEDFYASLVRDKRFAEEVGNLVVEFGDAAQQETLDRYLGGEDIPYETLRRIWSDTVGWIPMVNALGYVNFFAQVREVNRALSPEKRIHVWLGDPPIDWSQTKSSEDFRPKLGMRDKYPAELIKTEILAKHKKAIVIYGSFHFYGDDTLRALVEHDYPNSFYLVTPYQGFTNSTCSDAFEHSTRNWPTPAIAAPVHGTDLEALLRSPNCHFLSDRSVNFGPGVSEAEATRRFAELDDRASGAEGDALLFLGPAATLTASPLLQDLILDTAFRKEIERRMLIQTGQRLPSFIPLTSPRYLHPVHPN